MQKIVITTYSATETMQLAEQMGTLLQAGDCIAYFGGLGAGKTTFTRGLAKGMGLPDAVASPTFAIVNEYHGTGTLSLYHFDMYRIQGAESLETTGFYDYPLEENVFAVEWAENIADCLPDNVIRVTLQPFSETARQITIEGGSRFAVLGNGHFGQCGSGRTV